MRLATPVEPLGVFLIAECDLRMSGCTALTPSSVMAVRGNGDQFVACRSCLERMVAEGEWEIPHARIKANVDVLLADSSGAPVVAAMVKDGPRTNAVEVENWGSGIVRNLAAHGALPSARYILLLVLPDQGLLWSGPDFAQGRLPDYGFTLTDFAGEADPAPAKNGAEAETWAVRAMERLLAGEKTPTGLWWTESGLARALAGKGLAIVRKGTNGRRTEAA